MSQTAHQEFGPVPTIAVTLIGMLILMALPIINNGPFFYFDTTSYIEQLAKAVKVLFPVSDPSPEDFNNGVPQNPTFGVAVGDNIVKGGRSIYYSLPAYLGWITSLWLTVALQAVVISWLIVKLFQLSCPRIWARGSVTVITVISFLSSASFFAGLIMPDIWVGLMILALALTWIYDVRLTKREKFLMFGILTFGALAHNSHLALLAAMLVALAILQFFPGFRRLLANGAFALPMLALLLGIFGHFAFSSAIRVLYDARLIQLPHITAHLVDLGPGLRYVENNCPESGFAVCDYVDRLPVDWIAFLFDSKPETGVFAIAPQPVQQALSDEQLGFAIATLMSEPVPLMKGLLLDGLSQLWKISIDDVPIGPNNQDYIDSNFPTDVVEMVLGARIFQSPGLVTRFSIVIQVFTAFSAVIILLWMIQSIKEGVSTDQRVQNIRAVAVILLLGLFLNALICGVLASPYGRFQARIIWLLPVLAALVWTDSAVIWREKVRKVLGSP